MIKVQESSVLPAGGRRIAYLVNQYPLVSLSFVRREIRELERRGFTVDRIAIRGWNADLADAGDIAERHKTNYLLRGGIWPVVRAILIISTTRFRAFVRTLGLTLRLSWNADRPIPLHFAYLAEACLATTWLEEWGSEHLHAHFGTNSAELALLIHSLGGPPYSFTVHGPDEFDRGVYLHLDEKIGHSKFTVAVNSFCRSQMFRRVSRKSWPKLQIVHCGLEDSYFQVPPREPLAIPHFVCVGRLNEQKGQLLLLEAFNAVAADHDCHLVLAGDGEMRAQLEERIVALGLQDRVTITGWIDSKEVQRRIQDARAMVLPSFAESLPVVIMEAMALRRPVISTYVAGIPELVQHGRTGWLVPAGSIEELTSAMAECLRAPSEVIASMGAAAAARVVERHSMEREGQKLARLIEARSLENVISDWQP